MCDMETLRKVCDKNKVFLVEDACHAPTATLNGMPSGSFGDVSTFSFHATKHIGSGEGGVICTNIEEEYESLQTLRSHGLPHWSKRTGYGYDINEMAFNYRPNEISGSIAYSNLLRIDDLINKRKRLQKFTTLKQILITTQNKLFLIAIHMFTIYTQYLYLKKN